MVTRDDDPEFSNFVNAVVMSLFVAEQRNITKATASFSFPEYWLLVMATRTCSSMLYQQRETTENYTEYMEPFMPRQSVNRVNTGASGLMYAIPLGGIEWLEAE